MLLKTNEKLSDELAKLQAPTAVGGNAKFVDELATATKSLSNELTKLQTQTATEAEKIELLFQKHLNNSEQCELFKKLETCAQANKTNEAQKLQIQFKNDDYTTTTTESTPRPDSCKAFGGNPGVHEIKVPGLQHFEVLCQDDSSAGRGWIVIQQRIDGQENFQRDWVTYRDGFGSFDGDFFLGLRQIHHITHSQRYELYIYVEYFGGLWLGARYDNFRVGNEADQFKLQSLGEYHWTKVNNDKMRYHEHMKFTTYDRDNDLWYENCATDQETGGWWYNKCAYW
ncbi:maker635 [Drosophila busckii]|uniref:Maker635 n=1 Tax=Drosophila busckii TaxID=30019 RepID=A0A0M4EY41_DROBS|nr:maker635 [Drosophila busckii]